MAVKRHEQHSQIWTHMANNNHSFDFVGTEAIAQDTSKGGQLLKETWLSDEHTINHHIDLLPAYQVLRRHEQQRKALPIHRRTRSRRKDRSCSPIGQRISTTHENERREMASERGETSMQHAQEPGEGWRIKENSMMREMPTDQDTQRSMRTRK